MILNRNKHLVYAHSLYWRFRPQGTTNIDHDAAESQVVFLAMVDSAKIDDGDVWACMEIAEDMGHGLVCPFCLRTYTPEEIRAMQCEGAACPGCGAVVDP